MNRKRPMAVAPGEKSAAGKKIPWALVAVLVLATVSVLAAYHVVDYLGRASPFGLKALEVEGLRILDGDDVLTASGLAVGANIFTIDLKEVEQRLEQVCWVERALVVRRPPDRLGIQIDERRRAAWVELGAIYGISRDGVLLPKDRAAGEPEQVLNLPVISGIDSSGDSLWLGMDMRDRVLTDLLRWWEEAAVADMEFCLNVVGIVPLKGHGAKLQMADGLEVRLPLDRVERRLQTLRRLLPHVYREYPAPAYIDLRFAGQAVVGSKETG